MAAYAALVSVEHIINNLQFHCRPPISLHKEQVHLLTKKITFLQQFLEVYNPNLPYSEEADPLESRIARAAYAAEDAIESHILDQFTDKKMSSDGLYQALDKVIEDMALIEKEAISIKETVGFRNQLHTKSTPPDSSRSTSSSSIEQKKSMMVGADDLLLEMKAKLTAGARDLQTIPIVGMGGSGKTTLALNIFQDDLIKEHFYIRVWATVSHEYNIPEIFIQLLTQLNGKPKQGLSDGELGEMLLKHLRNKRFMVILDDMWSVKAWDRVKWYLPKNKNGSRIVITTREKNLASALRIPNSNILGMKLLNDDDSWGLLSKIVFGEIGCCPPEFEEIGKKIGKNCKGLPLSIVVVGGLLAKSKQSVEFWEHMEENLNAIVNLDDDGRYLKTLYVSYKQLPVHLKPCFLYMGIYHEDHEICISKLVRLWVAEGFLKPVIGKRLEDVARAYIKDLTDRNLILIHKLGSTGSIKYCKVHDLLRDLCLREAKKEGFYTIYPGKEITDKVSRIVMYGYEPLPRSLILGLYSKDIPPHILRLLRIVGFNIPLDNLHHLVNLRFFKSTFTWDEFPSLIWLFWNLQTLIVRSKEITAPTDIWYMSHIRHLYFRDLQLPDPPSGQDGTVLTNLQTLGEVNEFTFSEQVVKRIPNIRKLKIYYYEGDERFCLTNLNCLDKLESLACLFNKSICQMNYPLSLKKLNLKVYESLQHWQDILDKIGELPLLQKLKLHGETSEKGEWETSKGQFRSLKFLSLEWFKGLQVWTSDASHFPMLEQLHLSQLHDLEEIPSDFADISTLRLIKIKWCSDSAIESAKSILEVQKDLHGEEETLQIQVNLGYDNDQELKRFRGVNFHVTRFND